VTPNRGSAGDVEMMRVVVEVISCLADDIACFSR
jgi:hypothetical protein